MPSHIPGEKFGIQRNKISVNNNQTLSAFSGDSHDLESPGRMTNYSNNSNELQKHLKYFRHLEKNGGGGGVQALQKVKDVRDRRAIMA